jgi:large subunit ribosomal protein L25
MRTGTKKGAARVLRREEKIPAVLYGPGMEAILLSVQTKELEDALKNKRKGQILLNLVVNDAEKKSRTVMLKELQTDPVSRRYLHADFYHVPMDRKIRVKVPVKTTGKCVGVENGGIMQIIRRELEVLCYPGQIPEAIVLDITALDMGQAIHINDVPRQGDIDFPAEVNFTVITVLSPKGKGTDEEEEKEETEETEE